MTAGRFIALALTAALATAGCGHTGHHAAELHYLYGGLPLLVSLLAEIIRLGSAAQELGELDIHSLPPERQSAIALAILRRDTGIMAVACLVIFLLALRAAGTSTAF